MAIDDIATTVGIVTGRMQERMQERVDEAVARVKGAKAERTRNTLLAAAVDIMGDKGYTATTIDEIAEKAGVSKGVMYYHFKSKADMAAAILDKGVGEFTDALMGWNREAVSGLDAVQRTAVGFANLVDTHRQFTKFFVSELWRDDREWRRTLHSCEARIHEYVIGLIERGQREGSFRQDIDPEFISTAFVGMCLSLSLDWVTYHPTLSCAEFSDKLLDLIYGGIVEPKTAALR